MKPYLFYVILIVICGIAITLCEMAVPKFIQIFIDKVVKQQNLSLFTKSIALLVVVVIAMFGFNAANNYFKRIVQEKAARDLQYSIFTHLRSLGFSYFEKSSTGETLSLLNTDVVAVQEIYRQHLPHTIMLLLTFFLPFGLIVYMNYKLALIVIGCYLLYFTIGPYFNRMVTVYLEKQTRDRQALNKKIYDSISAVQEVRAYSAEQWDLKRLKDDYEKYKHSRLVSLWFRHLRGSVGRLTTSIGIMLFYIFSSMLVKSGELSVGQYVSYSFYYTMALRVLNSIMFSFTEQLHILYQAEKLYDFIKLEPDVKESESPLVLGKVEGSISFRNVHFGYATRPNVLNGFSIDIKKGERIALVGTSGNGKSTILKLIPRFYDPQQGEILLDGMPLKNLSLSQVRQSIGYVFQETYLFGSSVKENIRFGNPDASDEEVINASIAAQAHDFIMEMPQKYDTLLGERGVKLSGGQKQRIAIARMIVKNPSIILLDEATSALDNLCEHQVKKALDNLMNGRTTLAVAHRLTTILDYDRIVVVNNGRVEEIGNYDELIARKGLFFNLLKGDVINE